MVHHSHSMALNYINFTLYGMVSKQLGTGIRRHLYHFVASWDNYTSNLGPIPEKQV